MTNRQPKIGIVTPVFNDWESLGYLVRELKGLYASGKLNIGRLVVVDDGSIGKPSILKNEDEFPVTVLELNTNMGHQRAISVGLSYVEDNLEEEEYIVVMDSDGEDKPADILNLIHLSEQQKTDSIIFAKRQKRTEASWFKGFYKIYKLAFKLLTSHRMDFGNFSCIPVGLLRKTVSIPEIWNHYSGGIIKSRIPYKSVGTNRGSRYAGKSKMNFQNLVLHGMSAISIYLDVVTIRLLMAAFMASVLVVIGIMAIIYLALFTTITIPGWSSITALILINILSIVVLTTFLILLFQLNQKNMVKFPPKSFYKSFILSIKKSV